MLRAFKLTTGPDNASHVSEGKVLLDASADVVAVHFKEPPPHSSLDWHVAPETQYVLTLIGTLEFTTRDGATFVLAPGDVLIAADTAGSGHRWCLIDDHRWRRCYVVLKPGTGDLFLPTP